MQHGFISKEETSFKGLDKVDTRMLVSSLNIMREVAVGEKSYHFWGFRTSIVKWLMNNQERQFYVGNGYKQISPGAKISVRIEELTDGGTDQILGHVRSGFLGVMGTNSVVASHTTVLAQNAAEILRSAAGGALDGMTIYNRARGGLNAINVATPHISDLSKASPNRMNRCIDKILNNRIHVVIGCNFNDRNTTANVVTTTVEKISCAHLGQFLRSKRG